MCGVTIDVPLRILVAESPVSHADVMSTPGANQSTHRPMLENGARWFGPLVDSIDMFARDVFATRLKPFISRLPSEYMVTNVRVSPFNDFEPIDQILTQHPNLVDCYAYSSDYPHEVTNQSCKHDIEELLESEELTQGDKEAILHRNAERFYRL